MNEVKIAVSEEFEKKHSIRLYLRLIFHVLVCGLFYSVFLFALHLWYELLTRENLDEPALVTAKLFTPCYLTNWNFLFQTIFLSISLVYDVMEWLDKHESNVGVKIKYIRDVIFKGLVVPLTLFISSMFWTVYWIDRELVFPAVYDQLVPWWFNHCVHTNITIVILVETVLLARRHPTNFKLELWLFGGAGVLYAIVYYSIYFFSHRWLYGVFGIMTWWQICLYQILIWGSTFVFYFIQFPINRIFHREESATQKEITQEPKNGVQNGIQNGAYNDDTNDSNDRLKHRTKGQIENSRF